MKDRDSNRVTAASIERTDAPTLQGFVLDQVIPGVQVFTDDHGLPNHQTVKHSVGEYVDGMAHTNGIESFWAMLKRGYHGVYHKMSPDTWTSTSMSSLAATTSGKRIRRFRWPPWFGAWRASGSSTWT